jgi:glycosyltransferase involved in cell wall biosynthesis
VTRFAACTIVASNYLAQAAVLAESFARQHDGIEFFTLVIDLNSDDSPITGCGTVLNLRDLEVAPDDLYDALAIYDVMEFATAVKPIVLATLLRRGFDAVAYIDPDIQFFSAIDDVFRDAVEHGIVLTPHTVEPMPRDGRKLDETDIMLAGIFNLGFIAVGATAMPFLNWWWERLRMDAIVDVANALFTDQRWIDWVPALFSHHVRRDKGLNVAYWNLHERPLTRAGQVLFAGADPLRFIHFSGFDPRQPWLLSKHQGDRPRILLSENPLLREQTDAYAELLTSRGFGLGVIEPYRFDLLENGVRMTRQIRRLIRDVLKGSVVADVPAPNPHLKSQNFALWLQAPVFGAAPERLTPIEFALWNSRPDLQQAFPEANAGSARHYRGWAATDPGAITFRQGILNVERPSKSLADVGTTRPALADSVLSSPSTAGGLRSGRSAFGWSVVGYASAEMGVGEAGRRLYSLVERTGVPTELVGVGLNESRQRHATGTSVRSMPSFESAIMSVNADQLWRVGPAVGLEQLRGLKVGYWFWELEHFPSEHASGFDYVDEVWAATSFMQKAFQSVADRPVRLVPLPIHPKKEPTLYTRKALGMPESSFVFLTNFDYFSTFERKNPIGVIDAYLMAFGPNDGAVLIVKSINGHRMPVNVERVKAAARGRQDVVFLDDYVTAAQMRAMIELADCYVSLHRSEGLGLNMSDAIARRTPVVATAYSGNMDFMTVDTAALVPYELREIGAGGGPYPAEGWWAEPDLSAAAGHMRNLFDNREFGERMAERALELVQSSYSPDICAQNIQPFLLTQGISK